MAQANMMSKTSIFIPGATDTAFAAILPEIMALPDEETLPVNLDVVTAATTVLGRVSVLRTFRARIADELPKFNVERFDKLEQYALALSHAHGLHRGAQLPKGHIAALGNELAVIRDRFYGNAVSLAENGLLDGSRLESCKTAIGYRAVATDVLTLVPLFKEYWADIEGKTPVTPAALTDATNRAAQLLSAVGVKAQLSEVVGEKAQLRAKAFTLFVRAYEDARDAVEYLRRNENDAHELAPSLYAGRGGRRREEENDDTAVQPASPPAGSAALKSGRTEAAPPIVIENPDGLPIDNPFTS